jgi:hypothetical protein
MDHTSRAPAAAPWRGVEATPPDAMSRREEGAVPVDAASGREVQAASTDATPRREEGPGPVDTAAARCFTTAAARSPSSLLACHPCL